jgi:ribulose-phosphate 3-epimerase
VRVRSRGKRVGIALNPNTLVEALEPLLAEIDLVLCMTVYPGFSGQSFLPQSPERIRALRTMIDRVNPKCELSVDGGIDLRTAAMAVAAGATVLVAATAVFGAPEGPAAAVRALRAIG